MANLFLLKELQESWQSEKKNLTRAFTRVLETRGDLDRSKLDYSTTEAVFFDSEKYQTLTKIVCSNGEKKVDSDFVLDSDNEDEILELPRKRGRPEWDKPLTECSDTWFRINTNEIYETLLKFCSKWNIDPADFDKLISKLAMRFYFTAGENLNKKKGEMFNKVTLLEFIIFNLELVQYSKWMMV